MNSSPAKRLRVCVCTSYSAAAEPRAPRHALAIAALGEGFEVVFVDCLPRGRAPDAYDPFATISNIARVSHRYAHRGSGIIRLLFDKTARFIARKLFRWFGLLHPVSLNTRFLGFEQLLRSINATVYVGHNIETLVPACRAAADCAGIAIFDCMEFYSHMGESQNLIDRQIIERMERLYLSRCALVLASSDEMADALASTYAIHRPLALYNVPPKDPHQHVCNHDGLSLYWRNSVIGFGQRGLQDAFEALAQLPDDVTLHLQGRLPDDGGKHVRVRMNQLGIENRVFVHGPYSPPDAVQTASKYCVGLCLEHRGIRNHDLTVSNKMFDYLMAGLVVVTSDLPGLRGVIERSNGGLCFEAGNPVSLAEKILALRNDHARRLELAENGRKFALASANREAEMRQFQEAFLRVTETFQRETSLTAAR